MIYPNLSKVLIIGNFILCFICIYCILLYVVLFVYIVYTVSQKNVFVRTCQKLSKLVEIWQSSDKNKFAQFFWDGVYLWRWFLSVFYIVQSNQLTTRVILQDLLAYIFSLVMFNAVELPEGRCHQNVCLQELWTLEKVQHWQRPTHPLWVWHKIPFIYWYTYNAVSL